MMNPFDNWTDDQWAKLRLQDKKRRAATMMVREVFEKGASYRNNKMPVFSGLNTPFTKEVPAVIDVLEEIGVTEFVWASNASNFQEVLWIFQERGFRIDGMACLEYLDWRMGKLTVVQEYGLHLKKV